MTNAKLANRVGWLLVEWLVHYSVKTCRIITTSDAASLMSQFILFISFAPQTMHLSLS